MNSQRHEFGGDWTQLKLDKVRKYHQAYAIIFDKNEKARKLNTFYVDAFAGTGFSQPHRKDHTESISLFNDDEIDEVQSFKKGSAVQALEIEPSLKNFIFIDKSPDRVKSLEELKQRYPEKANRIRVFHGDANEFLTEWCKKSDWRFQRALVFLDPYGMQVEWPLIEAIAKTEAIDLWLLFPVGMGVMRMLPKKQLPPEGWCDCLTRVFGTDSWKEAFYNTEILEDLFISKEVQLRNAGFDTIGNFMQERLKSIFKEVVRKPLLLKNSKNVPMYLLCFAAGNPQGAKTAVKIAQDILK